MVADKFQIYSVRITTNTFVSQKIESVHIYSSPLSKLSPRFLSLSFQADRNCPFLPNSVF